MLLEKEEEKVRQKKRRKHLCTDTIFSEETRGNIQSGSMGNEQRVRCNWEYLKVNWLKKLRKISGCLFIAIAVYRYTSLLRFQPLCLCLGESVTAVCTLWTVERAVADPTLHAANTARRVEGTPWTSRSDDVHEFHPILMLSSTFTEKADYLWYNCTEVSWQIHQRKTTAHERPGLCYDRLWNNSLIHIIIILEILTLILYSSETPLLLPLCLIFRVVLMFFKEKKKKGGSMVKNWFPSVLILLFKPVSWMNREKCKWYYELMKKAKTGWIMHSKKDTMHMIHFQ